MTLVRRTVFALCSIVSIAMPATAFADRDDKDDKEDKLKSKKLGNAGVEAQLLMIGLNLTSTVATLLDQMSNAPTDLNGGPFPPFTPEETVILGKIGELLTDDIHVFTNGLDFYGKNQCLGGQRLVHSIRENNSIRFEMTPSLVSYDLSGPTPTFVMTTRHQHWWTNPLTNRQGMQVRVTQLTCVKIGEKWLIRDQRLQTVSGPFEVTLPSFQSPY